jgi:hypothetical protein
MTRQLTIEIDGDASGFRRAAGETTTAAGGMDRGLRNSAVGGAVAGLAMGGVTMAVGFVTDALAGAAEAAREDTASQDRLALALENTGRAQSVSTDQIEAAISANQAKGVADDEQREGISAFLDLTKDATTAMELNQAAVELAAAKGIAYADAQAMILSAASGRTAALEKAGVAVAADASAAEIAAAVNAQYAGSLDAVALTQGGKAAIANQRMGEAMERLGKIVNKVAEVVMPALADVMTFVMDNVVPPLSKAFEIAGPVIGKVFGAVAAYIKGFLHVVGNVLDVVVPIVSRLVSIFRGLGEMVGTVFGGIGGAVRSGLNGVIGIVNGIIRAINAIQVHIHVGPVNLDWNGLNLGYIPRMHAGGIVPGAPGSEVLTILQAGERVTPAGRGGGAAVIINIENYTGSDADIDRLADRMAMRLRLQGA